MATTYTPNAQLGQPAFGDRTWNVSLNANCTQLDGLAPVGGLCVTTAELPSTTLHVHIAGGQYVKQDGSVGTYVGAGSYTVAGSSTTVLFLDGTSGWTLNSGASYPATAHVRLATVVATASTITSVTDNRQAFTVCGSIADGVNIPLGTTTGLQIGTTAAQKLGFMGATPAVQQTGGAATAGGTYTATEQGMLQKAYNALRTFGLLS
jgi:hypothetical protein